MAGKVTLVVPEAPPWYTLSIVAMVVAGLCHIHANALVHVVSKDSGV